jgi:hypothetical protein
MRTRQKADPQIGRFPLGAIADADSPSPPRGGSGERVPTGEEAGSLSGYRWFESISLQQRVDSEPDANHPRRSSSKIQRSNEPCEKQAYRLADNELAARASWDSDLLRGELRDLKFGGFDLDLIGFEPDRLEDILAGLGSSGLTDPDSTPEVSESPVTQSGDIWLLGDHRIGCGDSTNAADVEPVLAGSQPNLMVTDPPFVIVSVASGASLLTSDAAPTWWRRRCSVKPGPCLGGPSRRERYGTVPQYRAFPGVRGNGIASRTLARPVT